MAEREDRLERQWALGGQGMNRVFADQGIDRHSNDAVADFVRAKIRQIVKNPETAERLCPYDHPIGSRRLCVDTDYYAT
jgi:cyclohexanone monooxygenase